MKIQQQLILKKHSFKKYVQIMSNLLGQFGAGVDLENYFQIKF